MKTMSQLAVWRNEVTMTAAGSAAGVGVCDRLVPSVTV